MLFVNISQAPTIIIVTLVLIALIFATLFRQKKIYTTFFSPRQRATLFQQQSSVNRIAKICCLVVISLMLGISLLDPRGNSLSSSIELEGMDVVLVYDISRSMDSPDVSPSRLKLAKNLGEQLVDSLAGNRIGLVAYAADAIRLLPLTTDISSVQLFIRELSSDMISSQSTDIGKALDQALKNFKADTLTHKAIILFSDGENLDGNINQAIDEIKKQDVSLFIVGIGTTDGGPVPIFNKRTQQQYNLQDMLGKEIISKLDEAYLQDLASKVNGKYYYGSRSSIEKLSATIETIEKSPFGTNTQSFLDPKFRVFILIALFALLLFLFLPDKKLRKTALVLLLISFGITPNYGLTTDRKAYQNYQKGEYSTALRFFQRSLVNNPKDLKAKIGEGATLYKLERSDRAEKSFLALTNSENKKIAEQALYNAGNAKVQGKDLEGALELYKKVMADNPIDSRLYKKALNNYIYTRALQQQKQDQQDQQKQDQQDPNNPQNKDQQDPNNPQNKDQQDPNNPQQSGEQEVPSQSISPSDIDNLLGIAEETEKENFAKQHKGKAGAFQKNKY